MLQKTDKHFCLNEISAMTNKGHFVFMVVESSFNGAVFLRFLKKLIKSFHGKVFLLADARPVHTVKKIAERLLAHKRKIEICWLPGYRPELNPVEYFTQAMKTNVAGKLRPRSKKKLKKKVQGFAYRKKKKPEHVKKYFHHQLDKVANLLCRVGGKSGTALL